MWLPDWRQIPLTALVRGVALLAILFGIYGGYETGHRAALHEEKSRLLRQSQHAHYVANWRRLMSLRATATLHKEPVLLPFSPADFQRMGARLVSWLPSTKGGDMSLETPWQQVPPVFLMLAERGMRVTTFALNRENNGALNFTLQLVRDDEP